MKILEIQYHRNGCHCDGFHVVRFERGRGKHKETFIAFVFDEEKTLAVVREDLLPNITFGENSWRGDEFEADLRKAIAEHNAAIDRKRGIVIEV